MQDEYGAREFGLMRTIALEQNKLLEDILSLTDDPIIMKKLAPAILEFNRRIEAASK